MEDILNSALSAYGMKNECKPFGNGHVNNTYVLPTQKAVLQQINTAVFKKPTEVMANILSVTAFLRKKLEAEGSDVARGTLTVLPTLDGSMYYLPTPEKCFRMCSLIDGVSYDLAEDPELLYRAAKAFGKFQTMLHDFPADTLYETIPDFHHTPKRIEALERAIAEDPMGRAADVAEEIAFARARAAEMSTVVSGLADGSIPLRVTHNDTKLNNVLFDRESGEPLAVIDLDTVMPGSMLYDFGDAIRFGAASAAEDETDLTKVYMELTKFAAFTRGYLEAMRPVITNRELELLPFAARLMTYECGIRFLTDHLNGDTYFRIHREGHNLDRARTQFKLVADMEAKDAEMQRVVAELWAWGQEPRN